MARPRIFEDTRRQINMYLHNDQYEWLIKEALSSKSSPSAIMRSFIDAHRGVTRDPVKVRKRSPRKGDSAELNFLS